MKYHKFQQIRVRINTPGESVRITAQTDKQYAKIRAIYVSLPEERLVPGSLLGLKVNNQEVFEDVHDIRLLTSGHLVAPNQKFFFPSFSLMFIAKLSWLFSTPFMMEFSL